MSFPKPTYEMMLFYVKGSIESECAYCAMQLFEQSTAMERVDISFIDASIAQPLLQRYRVTNVPRVVLIKDATCIHMHGVVTVESLRRFVSLHLKERQLRIR